MEDEHDAELLSLLPELTSAVSDEEVLANDCVHPASVENLGDLPAR